jgi:hypothetical protein
MSQTTQSSGNSVFGQLIDLIPSSLIQSAQREHQADRYVKSFKTHEHLVTMLYAVIAQCTSLREVSSGLQAFQGKLSHLGMRCTVSKSTLGDANIRRKAEVFATLYAKMIKRFYPLLSDSYAVQAKGRVKIIDSTTLSLFTDILKAAGRQPMIGKRKGGIKLHAVMDEATMIPSLVWFSSAATNDHEFLKHTRLIEGDIAVFDKGYNDYKVFEQMATDKIDFVTRLKDNAVYDSRTERPPEWETTSSVMKDEYIELEVKHEDAAPTKLLVRLIHYWDNEQQRYFKFITTITTLGADAIALLYKRRWQIELLFKKLKQNFQIKYFVGDSENAIVTQIWCVLIANLLFSILLQRIKRKWAFSMIVNVCRLHLASYFHLVNYLEKPNKRIQFWKPPDLGQIAIVY